MKRLANLLAPVLLFGCSMFQSSDDRRPPDGVLTTDRAAYLASRDYAQVRVDMRVRYTNTSDSTVYLQQCGSGISVILERLEFGTWREAWSPWCELNEDTFVEVAPGKEYEFSLRIAGDPPGGRTYPILNLAPGRSTYRLIVYSFVRHGSSHELTLLPLEHRVTNEFTITPPRR